MPAVGTLFGNRLGRRRELALWIISAAVERVALASPLFDEFAIFAIRALHANEVLLHILAFGISTARRELAKAAVTKDHVAFAQGAKFIERNVRHFLALIQAPRCFAIGIAGAGHELAESPTLENHDPAAVFAVLLLRRLLHVSCV